MVGRILLLSALLGCSDGMLTMSGEGRDAGSGMDGRVTLIDSALDEGATPEDGSVSRDVGTEEDGSLVQDAGVHDRGVMTDSGAPDTGAPDSGPVDPLACADESAIDADDRELFRIINDYRETRGLPRVPFSCSLSSVARQHVTDLIENAPNTGSCNLHSWSDGGSWSACCYTSDHARASCMWDKPRELTEYRGNGYEISTGGARSPQHSLDLWISSSGHHNVIINEDIWTRPWRAMGVAITPGRFAHVWFGHDADPAR